MPRNIHADGYENAGITGGILLKGSRIMAKKVSKLLSFVLVAALVLSLAVAAIWNQPAQALTADEITAAQTAAATELAAGQARADQAWNVLQSLPTPEEVKAGAALPTTCPLCGKTSVSWVIVTSDAETTTNAEAKHVYLAADLVYNGTATAYVNPGSTNVCFFTNGYNITSKQKPVFFSSNSVVRVVAWSRTSRAEGEGSVIKGYSKSGASFGSTVFSNGGSKVTSNGLTVAKGKFHMFGGTYEKYTPSSYANTISDHGNSGEFYMYEGTVIKGGSTYSAVNLSGTNKYASTIFNIK